MEKFRFPFFGIERIEQNYSQAMQDMFVLAASNGEVGGSYLEIGAYHPTFISNTYLLEKMFCWNGASIDYDPSVEQQFINSGRNVKFITGDATKLDYNIILSGITDYRVNYLQLDIEPNEQTLNCLKSLPLDNFRFSIITYETDVYDPAQSKEHNERVRKESREILESHGYVLVAGNISVLTDQNPFEDWYLDSLCFDKETINKFMRKDDSPMRVTDYMLCS